MIGQKLTHIMMRLVLGGIIAFPSLGQVNFLIPRQINPSINSVEVELLDSSPFYVTPEPAQILEPVELGVTMDNAGDAELTRYAQFAWSNFGIGQVHNMIGGRIPFTLPIHGTGKTSVVWIPQNAGRWCFYVDVYDDPVAGALVVSYQHNVSIQAHPDPTITDYQQAILVPVRNSQNDRATLSFEISASANALNWDSAVRPSEVTLDPGGVTFVQVDFTYSGDGNLPDGGSVSFDLTAMVNLETIGSVEFLFGPPLIFQVDPMAPAYASSAISVQPYPFRSGEPVEICAKVRNVTAQLRQGSAYFYSAQMGIGTDFTLVAPAVEFSVPEYGAATVCTNWVPPVGALSGFEVQIATAGYPRPVTSQRVIDSGELLLPGTTSTFVFPVQNSTGQFETITVSFLSPFADWVVSLDPSVLTGMQPDESRQVTLTVQIPGGSSLPSNGEPVVDVEAAGPSGFVGGFRKIYQPSVQVHPPGTPEYAENEIQVSPYPPQDREPTEICIELRNPTPVDQVVTLDYRWAAFGIGLPWNLIRTSDPVTVKAHRLVTPCTTWVPPNGGRFGFEIEAHYANEQESVVSQRVIDVGDVLVPNQPATSLFTVSNPYSYAIAVNLGAIRRLSQWEVTFTPETLNLNPGQNTSVQMTINPIQRDGDPEPGENQPVLDVEAYWEGDGQLGFLGGFRTLFSSPVTGNLPVQNEISVSPYPPMAGEQTHLAYAVRNPTDDTQQVVVTFEVSNFGIGIPFQPIDDAQSLQVPPHQTWVAETVWTPTSSGNFSVRVRVDSPLLSEPLYRERNVAVSNLPQPYGDTETFIFPVSTAGLTANPIEITLGLKQYLPDWQVDLEPTSLTLAPKQVGSVSLFLTPPSDPGLLPADGTPIVDVTAYVDGKSIGSIRKLWRPPVPLGQFGEPVYAESEISFNPDPPIAGQINGMSAVVRNISDSPQTVDVQFEWATFGAGLPFSSSGVVPDQVTADLSAHQVTTLSAEWTPPSNENFCAQIRLTDQQTQIEQIGQRNIFIQTVTPDICDPLIKQFDLYNSTNNPVTITLGNRLTNLPSGWNYSVEPASVALDPGETVVAEAALYPECYQAITGGSTFPLRSVTGGIRFPITLQVEAYDQNGGLIGGVEIKLDSYHYLYLPVVDNGN